MSDSVEAISVVGLGKLGAPIAACLAARGFEVVGVDLDAARVEALNHRTPPVFEPGLAPMLQETGPRLRATTDLAEAVRQTQATLIIVPTPSEPGGDFSLRFVLPTVRAIGQALQEKASYHLVTLTSTVMPGATGGAVLEALEEASGKTCGEGAGGSGGFGLCYSPEFVALGSVIRNFLQPDFLLIGQADPRSGDALESIYQRVCQAQPPVSRMSLVNAELAKIALNAFVTTKITFANMLSGICEQLPGADVDEVTAALGLDRRIGPAYLKGALGYGGPCFPRDNLALASLAREHGAAAELTQTVDRVNRQQTQRLLERVHQHLPEGGTVGVLGLAYKPETDVVEQSPGLLLAEHLIEAGIPVIAYDPAAMDSARRALGGKLRLAANMEACARAADVVVLTTPWKVFEQLDPAILSRDGDQPPRVLIDCWRQLAPRSFPRKLRNQPGPNVRYVAMGTGPKVMPARSMAPLTPAAECCHGSNDVC